jgi:hypothetical protein
MVRSAKTLLFAGLFGALFMLTGCPDDGPPPKTPEEIQLEKLVKVWSLTSSTQGGTASTIHNGMSLTLSGTAGAATYSYTVSGKPSPSAWPASGTWKFGSNLETQLIRDPGTADEINMNYSVTDTQLEVTFTLPTGHPGWRSESVVGSWVFIFN